MSANNHIISLYEDKQLAKKYYSDRPAYPDSMAEAVVKYIRSVSNGNSEVDKFGRMLDIACGSGQATHIFAPFFESILGVDISAQQLDVARERNMNENVAFQQVFDNVFPAKDNSIDFVNCATAVHWFNIKNFVTECNRVLKPRGCVALYSNVDVSVKIRSTPPAANQNELDKKYATYVAQFMQDCNGHPRNQIWMDKYRPVYNEVENNSKTWLEGLSFDKQYSLNDWKNYWGSKGEYHTFMKGKPATDPLEVFKDKVKRLLDVENEKDDKILLTVTFDVPTVVFSKQ